MQLKDNTRTQQTKTTGWDGLTSDFIVGVKQTDMRWNGVLLVAVSTGQNAIAIAP